ncbi:TonB-dependent receptor plug domain-containing protein [Sphingomonas histidinilytica]|jgi:iron complex outermembrane receptor protein|uniref:TonB-dependent receptor n=1 Tax=Rhizorhabdus histidinilytica TaxID=439228 RepID=UPI000F781379|nr:TonB-dependent receptor [Rhizorhabdus histidinilytica]MBO9376548.1 TonB-dependent receptor plug domain-containing protein [Rhizorhabdus histidinilytica]QEH76988.1 TonB-dependent receptor [Sphingomonas sp. C8-2]
MREISRARFVGMLLAGVVLSAVPAYAQDTTSPAAEAPEGGLADIVVTAEKRPSIAQRAPIALSVITSEAIKRQGVGNVADLTTLTPSVGFSQNGPSTVITVRGVSSRDTNQLGDPAVSISLDGFYFQRSLGLNIALFDLERVEALRGPQGTLLGRNATGGALNIITAKPTDDFSAALTGEVGNYDLIATQGYVNIPVNDKVKLRASFMTRDRDGYRHNAPARDGDDDHSRAARLHLLFQPTDRWDVLLTGEYSHQDGVGQVIQPVAHRFLPNGQLDTSRVDIPGDGKRFSVSPGSFIRLNSYNFRWNTNYDLDFATLTYLGGYRSLKFANVRPLGADYNTNRRNLTFDQHERPRSWNHELRLSSKSDTPLIWQAGLYYFREKNSTVSLFRDFRVPGQFPTPTACLCEPGVELQIFRKPDLLLQSKAVFGQASYAITEQFRIEGGARYSSDKKHNLNAVNLATNVNTYLNTGAINYVSNPPTATRLSSHRTTFHAAANYQWTPRNLLYAKYDTGYKSGGFTDLQVYGPENITAWEVGSKNRFLNNTLQLNLSAFLYRYKDQQVQQQITLPSGGIGTGTVNAGASKLYGGDIDIVYQVTPNDRIELFGAYLHARFTDFVAVVNGRNQQLAGNRLQQAPDWVFNAGYEHVFPVGDGSITTRLQTHYESKSYFTFTNYEADKQPGYMRSDIIVTYTAPDDRWRLEGYVRNLEDKLIFSNADVVSTTYVSYRYQYQAPRTYGARLTVNF